MKIISETEQTLALLWAQYVEENKVNKGTSAEEFRGTAEDFLSKLRFFS